MEQSAIDIPEDFTSISRSPFSEMTGTRWKIRKDEFVDDLCAAQGETKTSNWLAFFVDYATSRAVSQ